MQYVISNAVFSIVIAKAKPEATEYTTHGLLHCVRNDGKESSSLRGGTTKQSMLRTSGLLHCVRNDEQGVEVLFSEEVYFKTSFAGIHCKQQLPKDWPVCFSPPTKVSLDGGLKAL
jgi:hypothetical protein